MEAACSSSRSQSLVGTSLPANRFARVVPKLPPPRTVTGNFRSLMQIPLRLLNSQQYMLVNDNSEAMMTKQERAVTMPALGNQSRNPHANTLLADCRRAADPVSGTDSPPPLC